VLKLYAIQLIAKQTGNHQTHTVREHMPSSHRRLRRQADAIGRNTSALVEIILRERAHPEQGFRACVGIVRLAKTWVATAAVALRT
jgi:hypothetical protein